MKTTAFYFLKTFWSGKKSKATMLLFAAFCLSLFACRSVGMLPDGLSHTVRNLAANSFWFLLFFGFAVYYLLKWRKARRSEFAHGMASRGRNDSESRPEPKHSERKSPVCADKYRFVDKIPEYKILLEQWMEREKPYLNRDFKLLDVMQALPLNRSYLSRMFNEAYDETFFSFVMRYRLCESVRLLDSRPDLTVSAIARACGFSSASVFCRAFLKNKSVTPQEYRKRQSRPCPIEPGVLKGA